jgi:hypothetical protein
MILGAKKESFQVMNRLLSHLVLLKSNTILKRILIIKSGKILGFPSIVSL